jgi:ubiquinone/menaquinone biosynthesis C-methylase UbiE
MKLHLGCGKIHIPGFVHVDIAEYPHIDIHASLDNLPLDDNSADLIYCCHALTYYDRFEVPRVLSEWHRVLKYGGIVRVSVTDFRKMILVYGKTKEISKIIGPIFGRWEVTEGSGKYVYHKTIFDEASLKIALETARFFGIREWYWKDTEHTSIDDCSQAHYPHMDKVHGVQISLNMEGTK